MRFINVLLKRFAGKCPQGKRGRPMSMSPEAAEQKGIQVCEKQTRDGRTIAYKTGQQLAKEKESKTLSREARQKAGLKQRGRLSQSNKEKIAQMVEELRSLRSSTPTEKTKTSPGRKKIIEKPKEVEKPKEEKSPSREELMKEEGLLAYNQEKKERREALRNKYAKEIREFRDKHEENYFENYKENSKRYDDYFQGYVRQPALHANDSNPDSLTVNPKFFIDMRLSDGYDPSTNKTEKNRIAEIEKKIPIAALMGGSKGSESLGHIFDNVKKSMPDLSVNEFKDTLVSLNKRGLGELTDTQFRHKDYTDVIAYLGF